ncbi:MAG: hypothetical protein H6716_25120 [Polyangiaceae bacterium]|nr:hypothetical protein [Polyangiaceae bacterium]
MNTGKRIGMLVSQLEGLLTAPWAQRRALEVASLAGLLAREVPSHSAVLSAEAWADGPGAEPLANAVASLDLAKVVSDLEQMDPTAEPEEQVLPLFQFDEVCAGLHWAGAGEVAGQLVEAVKPTVRAFPEVWSPFAQVASRLLASVEPECQDPGLGLWRAIEATSFEAAHFAPDAPRALRGRVELGLGAYVVLPPPAPPQMELRAASDALENVPVYRVLGEDEDDVQVLLETPPRAPPRLIIYAPAGSRVELVGLELRQEADDEWSAEAQTGEFELVVDDTTWPIVIE